MRKPMTPHGIYDNQKTMQREVWWDGERKKTMAAEYIRNQRRKGGTLPEFGEYNEPPQLQENTMETVTPEDVRQLMESDLIDPHLVCYGGQITVMIGLAAYRLERKGECSIVVGQYWIQDQVDPDGELDWDNLTEEDLELIAQCLNQR